MSTPGNRRGLERFGGLNDIRSNSYRERTLDLRNGMGSISTINFKNTLETGYARDSLSSFGNTFRARVLGVAVGTPSRRRYPEIFNSTIAQDDSGKVVEDYFLFFLRMEFDSFTPDPDLYCNTVEQYTNLSSLQGRAISRVPANEFEPVGPGDIVEVYLPNQNSYDGALVNRVVIRNSADPFLPPGREGFLSQAFNVTNGAWQQYNRGTTRGTTLGAGVSVAGGFLGFESKELATAYESPGAPLTSNCRQRFVNMRPDALSALEIVVQKIIQAGGAFHTSGARRGLGATVSASRSSTSLHYLGRAIDLCTSAGMNRPQTDPYVITRDPSSSDTWIVYARSVNPDRLGISENLTLQAVKSDNTEETVTGKFINLTDLFSQSNFDRIPARSGWRNSRTPQGYQSNYLSSEWWHFQWEAGLVARETTFGSQLQQVWTLEQLQGTGPWVNSRNKTWNGSGAFT